VVQSTKFELVINAITAFAMRPSLTEAGADRASADASVAFQLDLAAQPTTNLKFHHRTPCGRDVAGYDDPASLRQMVGRVLLLVLVLVRGAVDALRGFLRRADRGALVRITADDDSLDGRLPQCGLERRADSGVRGIAKRCC
jgi:hypothetical protein